MIIAGQKDAKKRVFLFFFIYFVTGTTSESPHKAIHVDVYMCYNTNSINVWCVEHCGGRNL